jgi:hypothetical protein
MTVTKRKTERKKDEFEDESRASSTADTCDEFRGKISHSEEVPVTK